MTRRGATWVCLGLAFLWLILSWTAGDSGAPNTSVVISSVFLAAAFVIGAVRS